MPGVRRRLGLPGMNPVLERQGKKTTTKEAKMHKQNELANPLRTAVRVLQAAHRRSADEWIRHMEAPTPPRRAY
jgi:hypothetical protein